MLVAKHNLVHDLHESGNLDEALSLLQDIRPLYFKLGDRINLIRMRWLEGKIANERGKLVEAEAALGQAQLEFGRRGMVFDVALVSLDLASVYARQGRICEMKALAAEMLAIFRSLSIHREAIAALLVFQRAAEMERITLALIAEIASYFEKARENPSLKFRPTSVRP